MEPACDDQGACCPAGTIPTLGTANADILNTAAAKVCFVGLGGPDIFVNTAPAGLHAALGGPGNDLLLGGFGPAILAGGEGNDVLTSRAADDALYGGPGNDSLTSLGGDDQGFGGPGDDTINLGPGDDEADGGFGNDALVTGSGADDPLLLCREDVLDGWTCHPCSFDGGNYLGCPCSAEQPDSCPVDLTCLGNLPDLPAIDGQARGACWPTQTPPEGYCAELCAATARICGTTVGLPDMCLIPDCDGLGYCEFHDDVCDRSGGPIQCIDVCDEFLNPCDPNESCTPWGECWG